MTIDNVVSDLNHAYAEEQLEHVRATAERNCAKLLADHHAPGEPLGRNAI